MQFWQDSAVSTLVVLALLLAVGLALRPVLRGPPAIVGGTLGLILGPGALAWLPLDLAMLESGVYHALAVVFIALGLQRPPPSGRSSCARSMAFGITAMVALQTCVGLGLAMALGEHPGFGLLLPLGFEQGPGQALSMGAAWEASGLQDGAQIGLILAALGFGWAVVAGVPLVAWGRRMGWVEAEAAEAEAAADPTTDPSTAGGLAPLAATIALVYALTWGACTALSTALADLPDIAAMVWGFHFLIGSLIAGPTRRILDRVGAGDHLDDRQLGRVSALTVDLATVAALSAVQVAVVTAWWLPLTVISTTGGVLTLMACVWLGRRGFSQTPFAHTVLWFGMSTGTLPLGMTLLRGVDPELRSPAPASAVYGSALAVFGLAPILLVLHPLAISGSPALALGGAAVWLAATLGGWVAFGGLKLAAVVDGEGSSV